MSQTPDTYVLRICGDFILKKHFSTSESTNFSDIFQYELVCTAQGFNIMRGALIKG